MWQIARTEARSTGPSAKPFRTIRTTGLETCHEVRGPELRPRNSLVSCDCLAFLSSGESVGANCSLHGHSWCKTECGVSQPGHQQGLCRCLLQPQPFRS